MSFRKNMSLVLLLLLFFIPGVVHASSSLNLSCDSNNNAGDVLTCGININVEEGTYNKVEAVLDLTDASSITFEGKNSITGNVDNNKLVINNVSGSDIGSLKIKFSNSTSGVKNITFSSFKVYNDDTLVTELTGSSKVTVKSSDNTLSSLTVGDCNNCSLSPTFKSNITIYVVNTKSDKINISAVAASKATVTGAGVKTLTKDSETFKIVVTSESGSTKTYRITVNKEKSTDVSLSNLTIDKGNLSPKFSSNVTNYTAVVDSDKVVIKATPNNSKVTVTGTGEKTLEYGKNEFTITVTSEDGGSKSYLITINRPDNRNANAYLKSLTIDGKDIDFEKDVVDYEYKVGKDVDSLDIEAIPELDTSKVEITGNENFKIGKNIVTITVKAEDNSEKIYKMIVVKEDKVLEELYLDNLKIDGYDIKFNKEIFEYTLTIGKEKSLNIIAFNDNGYITEIVGNENLKDGSIIKIIVSDEDGNSSVYQIRVKVSNNDTTTSTTSNTSTNYIPYIMTSLLVLLFILDLVQIIKKVRNK